MALGVIPPKCLFLLGSPFPPELFQPSCVMFLTLHLGCHPPLTERSEGEAGSGSGFGKSLHGHYWALCAMLPGDMLSSLGAPWVSAADCTPVALVFRALWAGLSQRGNEDDQERPKNPAQEPWESCLCSGELPLLSQEGRAIGLSSPFLTGCLRAVSWFVRHGAVRPTPVSVDAFIKTTVGTECLKWLMALRLPLNEVIAFLPIEMGMATGSFRPPGWCEL